MTKHIPPYSPEVRARAVRMVFDHQGEHASQAAQALRLTHIPTEVADGVSFCAHEGDTGRRHAKGQASR